MAISHGTWPVAARMTSGTIIYKNLYNNTFAYTETQKKVAAGTSTAVHAAINGATTVITTTTGITQPDVPRALSVTAGGTSQDILDSAVTINGTNVEGATISEAFRFAAGSSATVNGGKAFKTVTSIVIGQQGGAGGTFAVGTTNKLGVNHRLYTSNTTVKVYSSTVAYGALTTQLAPTVVASSIVENNLVTPATTPNGSLIILICYAYDNWSDGTSINDQPEYSTTTSTSSTSSSTSTSTITTSTSSTSISTSSTSTSISTSSTSTSSTSTSTTTTP